MRITEVDLGRQRAAVVAWSVRWSLTLESCCQIETIYQKLTSEIQSPKKQFICKLILIVSKHVCPLWCEHPLAAPPSSPTRLLNIYLFKGKSDRLILFLFREIKERRKKAWSCSEVTGRQAVVSGIMWHNSDRLTPPVASSLFSPARAG